MSQQLFYKPVNSLELVVGDTYTTANIPSVVDTVVLSMGVRLSDNKGELTPLRGVRMQIVDNETLPANPKPKVPYVWTEGTELVFDPDYSYVPLDWGIVAYGLRLVP